MYKRQIYQIAESNRNFFCPNWNALPASAQIHQAFDGQSSLTGSITLHACPPRASLADDQFHSHSHACGNRETVSGAQGGTDRRHDEQGQLPLPRISDHPDLTSDVSKAASVKAKTTATCCRSTASARQRTTDESTLFLRSSQVLATSLTTVNSQSLNCLISDGQSQLNLIVKRFC